jgi:hypothetical protein
MIKKLIGVLFALLIAAPAYGQSVQQSGTITRNSIPVWISNGVIGQGGTAADSPISSIGATGQICSNSARVSSGAWAQLCLQANTNSPSTISLQNLGTAPTESLNFVINGTTFPFPGSLSNITIGTTPVVGGTNSLCLFVSGGFVGQQACTLSAITSLTGDVTGTGPGVTTATLAASGVTAGTYGSASAVPIITFDAKGRATSASTAPFGLTIGSNTIASGSNNGILYDNGGLLGNLTTLGSAILVTSAGGVPSMATTLPSGLTIPSPTFTGTETFPDAATWTSTGITKVSALSVGSATLPSGGNVSISGQYQINGTQISAATGLSNGSTGSGAVVLASAPAISGTWTGNPTFSGNITFSGQLIGAGTSAPSSAGGNTVVMGTITAPTLSNTGQAYLFNTLVGGAFLQGDGSTSDITLANKSAATVFTVPTGSTKLNFPSLASGTCSTGVGLDSGNNLILVSCPGAASSIQVGTTTIASGSSGNIEFNNSGTLGEITPQNGVAIVSTGLVKAETVNAQTGTSYAINNTDRGKLVTFSNAAAISCTIAQANTGGNFIAGWTADLQNINAPGTGTVVTCTATTSLFSFNGTTSATLKIYPGQTYRLVSDGTNYIVEYNGGSNWVLLNTLTASVSGTLSDTTSLTAQFSEYEIVFENFQPATTNASCVFQVHSGGSFQATGYGTTQFTSNSAALTTITPTTYIPLCGTNVLATGSAGLSFSLKVMTPSSSALHGWFGNGNYGGGNPTIVAGIWQTSAVIDGFQFCLSTSAPTCNINMSGTIKVYGRL